MDGNFNNNEEQDVSNYEQQEQFEYSTTTAEPEPLVKVNYLLGMIGAVIGSLVGVALWLAVDRIGFIAGICGVAILGAAMQGYKMLGRRLDRFGAIFCVILSFVMIFVSVNLSLIVAYIVEVGMDIVNEVGYIELLKFSWTDKEIVRYIVRDLGVGYALYVWSGFTMIKKLLKGEAS